MAKELRINIRDAVEDVEENFDCTLISYVANIGAPESSIVHNDAILLDDLLYNLPADDQGKKKFRRVGLFLHSGGGIMESAIKFVDVIRQYADEYIVIVPLMAKSAATLMVLSADRQYFTTVSELGPVDPVVQSPMNPQVQVPATAIENFIKWAAKSPEATQSGKEAYAVMKDIPADLRNLVDPYLLGAYQTSIKFSQDELKRILPLYAMKGRSEREIADAVEEFTTVHKSHGYPITLTKLEQFGIGERIKDEDKLGSVKMLLIVFQQFMANSNIVKLIGNRFENKNITITARQGMATQQSPTKTSI
ncbi:MAG: hypothetical protein U0Q19_01710 [Kineosporiaceae bacterium]